MDRLFNSTFENSLRLLILLDEYDLPKSLDMLYAVDFMTLYGASFGITDQNLNGDNEYKFSVFASHRESIQEALKALVLNGTAQAVSYNEGLAYIITPEGEDFCQSLSSTYAKEYRKAAQAVIKAVGKRSERATIDAIYKLSAKSFWGGDNE